ncbi:MAG: SAM-dependent methyltransferase [Kofleriaceae bacterium]
MKAGRASKTAAYVAAYRALESTRPDPLFRDPYAAAFLPVSLQLAVKAARVPGLRHALIAYSDHRALGARTSAIARTAAIDEIVVGAARDGMTQLVLLGAGFDCRAHRLALPGVTTFEVDRVETQAIKRRVVPSGVRYVEVDFLRDDAFEKLAAAGWQRDVRSLIVWEGVTNYLTEDAVLRVLSDVGRCAPGTRIAFTYIHRGVLDGSVEFVGGAKIRANVAALDEPWTWGITPDALGAFVSRAGLSLVSDAGADEYRQRWLGETSPGYAFYRLSVAEKLRTV